MQTVCRDRARTITLHYVLTLVAIGLATSWPERFRWGLLSLELGTIVTALFLTATEKLSCAAAYLRSHVGCDDGADGRENTSPLKLGGLPPRL